MSTNVISDDVTCLAKNIYYESRGEPNLSREAVAKVTLNRINSDMFPGDVCSVVFQAYQFSWTLNKNRAVVEPNAWKEISILSHNIINKGYDPYPGLEALWFHDTSVTPSWAKFYETEVIMLPLIFYKE